MKTLLTTFVFTSTLVGTLFADEPSEVKKLTLSPMAETTPAMRHKLVPGYLERREGNAVPLYTKAIVILADQPMEPETVDLIERWLEMPLDEMPHDEARNVVKAHEHVLSEVAMASRRVRCEWDMAIRERGKNLFAVLLPEVQHFRTLSRLLALKARLQIAEGNHDEAIETIQIGLGMSRHVSQQPFLISGLVAVAIANNLTEQLEQLIASEGAPNLYWSVAALPSPFIDWRTHLEMESAVPLLMYPELDEIEEKEMTAHQWRQLWRRIVTDLGGMANMAEADGLPEDVIERLKVIGFADLLVELRYPLARKAMIERGHDEENVDAMARAQVTLLNELYTIQATYDDMLKWSHVPYWQSREGFDQIEDIIDTRRGGGALETLQSFSFADMLVPAVRTAIGGYQSVNHRLGAIRTIEAIRLHAAANDGALPMTLDAIAVPLPINPYTGKPAEYELVGDTATLTISSPRDGETRIYKLRIRE